MHRFLTIAFLFLPLAAHAADAGGEAKLRESLRNTMLQLRTMQGERDTLAAEKTQLETDKKALAEQNAKMLKDNDKEKAEAQTRIDDLTKLKETQAAELVELRLSLDKWKASQQEAAKLAETKEAARAVAAQQVIELKRKVADQQTRNLGMYKVAKEVLGKYENFGLGTALAAREPFTGNMRVKLENYVQDLGDKIDDQRIKPDPAPSTGRKR